MNDPLPVVSDHFSPVSDSRSGWTCPRCTAENDKDNLNCTACCVGKNPYQSDTTSQLLKAQEKRHLWVQQSSKKSITTRVGDFFSGWTCPVCETQVGVFTVRCPTCEFVPFGEKGEEKKLTEPTKSSKESSKEGLLSLRPVRFLGSIFGNSKPQKSASTFSYGPPPPGIESPVDSDKHHHTEQLVVLTKDDKDVFSTTIEESQCFRDGHPNSDPYEFPAQNDSTANNLPRSPVPSIDSGMCTASDTTSHRGTPYHFEREQQDSTQQYNTPSICTEPSIPPDQTWKCTMCSAFNRVRPGQTKCYVCNIGNAPPEVMAALSQHTHIPQNPKLIETVNNHPANMQYPADSRTIPYGQDTSQYAQQHYAPQPVNRDGASRPSHPHYPNGSQTVPFGQDTSPNHSAFPQYNGPQGSNGQYVPHTSAPVYHRAEGQYPVPIDSTHTQYGQEMSQNGHFSRPRPKALAYANNQPRNRRNSSFSEDELPTPTPYRNCTQLIEVKRREDAHKADAIFKGIRQDCLQNKQSFIDPEFHPSAKSLYIDPKHPVSHWRVAGWKRPQSIVDPHTDKKTQWTVFRNPDPADIAQGVLGNCWVLSALSVIANVPELIERIMVTKEYSHLVGAYQVRLCKDGVWKTVVVDDWFPCYSNGQLVFSKAHRKQLWVPLIEKAIAKLYGSYEALNSGRVLAGLSLLTGLPCEKIHLKKQSESDADIDEDLVWGQLLSFKELGFPMGASCGGYNILEEDYYRVGLEPNHAYSILDVLPLELEGQTYRLLRLRNPWAKCSWRGQWSDGDGVWSRYPQLREDVLPMGGDVGIFWIEMKDVYRYFCEIDVCKYRPEWSSTSMESRLPAGAPSQYSLLAFHVPNNSEVDVCIYQETPRGETLSRNMVDLAALVLRYPVSDITTSGSIPLPVSCSLVVGSHIQSIVSGSGLLEPGSYVILPLAFNHWSADQRSRSVTKSVSRFEGDRDCVVSVFSSRMLTYEENVQTRPGFLAESLFLLATNTKATIQPYSGMHIHEVCLRHGCRIIVAFNENQHRHFTVTCNALESQNIVTTRGELYTVDCIPPMHRQVLMVMTQLEPSESYFIYLRIEFQQSTHNYNGQWGALHQPELFPSIQELHSPRLC